MKVDLELLDELIGKLEASGLSELEVSDGKAHIRLKRDAGQTVVLTPGSTVGTTNMQPTSAGTTKAGTIEAPDDNGVYVTSPFVGTFYRAASPEADPFIQAGDTIRSGQTLCIIEAMKLMNEIESEVEGTVLEVLVETGKPVEYGDRLFKIKPA